MSDEHNPFAFRRVWGPQVSAEANLAPLSKVVYDKSSQMILVGGPCSFESPEQIDTVAREIGSEITHFRGGVFRAGTYASRSVPYGWRFDLLLEAHKRAREIGKPLVIDVVAPADMYSDAGTLAAKEPHYAVVRQLDGFSRIYDHLDVIQVGARLVQAYDWHRELSRQPKPVFIKEGLGITIDELLGVLTYYLEAGKTNLALVVRGQTRGPHCRYTADPSLVVAIKQICNVPVIFDASHGTGRRDLVERMAYAGIVAGSDGLLLETHPNPERSFSDADQAISFETFKRIVINARVFYERSR